MGAANTALEEAYKATWLRDVTNSENCSGFIKSLGATMGFDVPDKTADGIIDGLEANAASSAPTWNKLGVGGEGLKAALSSVANGHLVLVAASAKDYGQAHGHVAVLLPKQGPHKAPFIYGGGSPGARSAGTRTLREVWTPTKHGILRYFEHRSVLLGQFD